MPKHSVIALTGGSGGGKSTLIEDLKQDPAWAEHFVALPEAIQFARFTGISGEDKLFQRVMVYLQMSLEDGVARALGPDDPRVTVCHRGSLDPLAYWQYNGWSREEFFTFTGTSLEDHYTRYAAVIHLVTAADGVAWERTRWETPLPKEVADEIILLDHLLQEVWCRHPHYYRIDNEGRNWTAKAQEAKKILDGLQC